MPGAKWMDEDTMTRVLEGHATVAEIKKVKRWFKAHRRKVMALPELTEKFMRFRQLYPAWSRSHQWTAHA